MDAICCGNGNGSYDCVSIHAPVMDAMQKAGSTNTKYIVSIHAPVMDAIMSRHLLSAHQRFNPRARDGRDLNKGNDMATVVVSIHAPVMDAIAQYGQVTPPPKVSIHAPVMDAIWYLELPLDLNGFNPRARDGRDEIGPVNTYLNQVSIHAPVMDAMAC